MPKLVVGCLVEIGPEIIWRHGRGESFINIVRAGPNLVQIDRISLLVCAQRLGRDINIRPSCKGESDDRWWGHEEAIIQIGVHAAGEVAIAGQHCHGRAFLLGNLRSQRA